MALKIKKREQLRYLFVETIGFGQKETIHPNAKRNEIKADPSHKGRLKSA